MSQSNPSTKCVNLKCKNCNNEYYGYRTSKFCSDKCTKEFRKDKLIQKLVRKSLEKYPDGSDKDNYVECKICGYRSSDLAQHPQTHGLTQEEYKDKYGNEIKCKRLKESMCGINNPAYNHGGKFSPFSKKFIKYTDDTADSEISNIKKRMVKSKKENNSNPLNISYYISRGFSTEESQKLLKERQSTFSLNRCIQKYGEKEGKEVWNKRQEKWLKSFKKNNFSKISQELFDSISSLYDGDIYYATKNKEYKHNQEYRLKLYDGSTILPDFICLKQRKIIEFDGDYWHSEKISNPLREKQRDLKITNSDYKLLHIKEHDYRQNKEKIIDVCVNFLTQ